MCELFGTVVGCTIALAMSGTMSFWMEPSEFWMDIVCPALALMVEAESRRITLVEVGAVTGVAWTSFTEWLSRTAVLSIILTICGETVVLGGSEEVDVVVTGVTEDCEIVLMCDDVFST